MMEKLYKLNNKNAALENIGVGSNKSGLFCQFSIFKYIDDDRCFNIGSLMENNTKKKLALVLNTALYLIMPKKEY